MTSDSSVVVVAGAQVTLHFSLALTDGNLIDSNYEREPATFRLGDGNMLPGFEAVLMGLGEADEIERLLPAVEAFGESNPKNRQVFPREKFEHILEDDLIPTEIGSVVSFKDPGGFDLPGVIEVIGDQSITVNFNHPLAGKDIVFKAKILSILPPEQQAVEIKL